MQMTESKLAWMKKTEQRFFKQSGSHSNQKNSRLRSPQKKEVGSERVGRVKSKTLGRTLDSYFPKKTSVLFDENFGMDDFRLLTRSWQKDNLVAEAE